MRNWSLNCTTEKWFMLEQTIFKFVPHWKFMKVRNYLSMATILEECNNV